MTCAEPGQGEQVRTTAAMPDGTEVKGDAWFRVDRSAQRIQWGSPGPGEYFGHLQVQAAGRGSEVPPTRMTTGPPRRPCPPAGSPARVQR